MLIKRKVASSNVAAQIAANKELDALKTTLHLMEEDVQDQRIAVQQQALKVALLEGKKRCIACGGSGVSSRGGTCSPCKGSGFLES
jgi:DnaJ-class molecular chaperone